MENPKEMLLIETVVKMAAIQKIMIRKGLCTEDEIYNEMTTISKELVEQLRATIPEIFTPNAQN